MKYTLVQHTGFTQGGNPEFHRAVEARAINRRTQEATTKVIEAIVAAGGLVLDDWSAANDREEQENYPPDVGGLVPRVTGKFVMVARFTEAVYVPA